MCNIIRLLSSLQVIKALLMYFYVGKFYRKMSEFLGSTSKMFRGERSWYLPMIRYKRSYKRWQIDEACGKMVTSGRHSWEACGCSLSSSFNFLVGFNFSKWVWGAGALKWGWGLTCLGRRNPLLPGRDPRATPAAQAPPPASQRLWNKSLGFVLLESFKPVKITYICIQNVSYRKFRIIQTFKKSPVARPTRENLCLPLFFASIWL